MPDPKRVKAATDMLRAYRDYLRDCDEKLRDIEHGIDRGRVPIGVTDLEAERLRTIGSARSKVAVAIEQANEDTKTTFTGAAGMADTASGFFGAAGWANLLTAVAGAVIATGQMVEEQSDISSRLAESQTRSTVAIKHQEYMTESPSDRLSESAYPKDPRKWKTNED